MSSPYNFHVPVMGVAFTVDTPIKIAHFGVSSVMSIGDDLLLERLRAYYSEKHDISFVPIKRTEEDYRAKRITAYLDLVYDIVHYKFEKLKQQSIEKGNEIYKYFDMLPDTNTLKKEFLKLTDSASTEIEALTERLKNTMSVGELEVNIMTKLDRQHYDKAGNKLPTEFNDAHSALRGYANSKINSGLVLSAGLNPRLYSYIANFDNFYPDQEGNLDKQVILKVSDYRSALIQGKFLAKKGIWVSEYRVESGLNCGGHAFASDGFMLGPIMEEFKNNREQLIKDVHEILNDSLEKLGKPVQNKPLPLKVTAQGGVGTYEEHQFLIDTYQVDSVGWGTPFLLVPEAVNVDAQTSDLLVAAGEDDLYLSSISPIGVPFNTVRGNSKDVIKQKNIDDGNPGSTCPRQYLKLFNTEFTEQPICLSSKQYQKLKIKELDELNLEGDEYDEAYQKITEKACLCTGLVITAYKAYGLETKPDGQGVSVCPGPNLAYFSKISTLKEMIDHIYGRTNILNNTPRPNFLIKELNMYVDYFKNELKELPQEINIKQQKRFVAFKTNLLSGIEYYLHLFSDVVKDQPNAIEALINQKQVVEQLNIPTLIKV